MTFLTVQNLSLLNFLILCQVMMMKYVISKLKILFKINQNIFRCKAHGKQNNYIDLKDIEFNQALEKDFMQPQQFIEPSKCTRTSKWNLKGIESSKTTPRRELLTKSSKRLVLKIFPQKFQFVQRWDRCVVSQPASTIQFIIIEQLVRNKLPALYFKFNWSKVGIQF